MDLRAAEVGGAQVEEQEAGAYVLRRPVTTGQYANAQIDDYTYRPGAAYIHRPGLTVSLQARFSHPAGSLLGTAGFGFWNDPLNSLKRLALTPPQATWFFYGSAPNDLPFAPDGPGRGWFASTIDAGRGRALAWVPFAPLVLLLNQWPGMRRRLWPAVQRSLNISFAPLDVDMTEWHDYRLTWREEGCIFTVDDRPVLHTPASPRGPLGFVCWLDNQYMVATATGRFRWGTLDGREEQWLAVRHLVFSSAR